MKYPLFKLVIWIVIIVALFFVAREASASSSVENLDRVDRPTLMTVYQQALEYDAEIRSAEANYNAVKSIEGQRWADLLPNLNMTANTAWNLQNILVGDSGLSKFNSHGYAIELRQPIVRLDAWAGLSQAKDNTSKAQNEFVKEEQALLFKVPERYLNVLVSKKTLEVKQAEEIALAKQLEDANVRFELGAIPITDQLEVQSRHDQAVAAAVVSRNDFDIALSALTEITGEFYKDVAEVTVEIPLYSPSPIEMAYWIQQAQNLNPQVQAAFHNMQAAKQEIWKQRAGHLPTLDAVSSTSYTVAGGRFGGFKSKDHRFGLEFQMPLFESGRISSKTEEAEFRYQAARQEYLRLSRLVTKQSQEAYLNVLASIRTIHALRQARDSSEKAFETINEGYKVGARTQIDVLNAQSELYDTRQALIKAYNEYLLGHLKLKELAGELSVHDIESIDSLLS